ncbi:hypothetical protein DFH08DRAFT_1070508 [Mycena albidolilacea]|uniref:Uncharacterized protein n=1 Tax=Mycena albidolilacea TaxID=1033008 RepID=A0AAD7AU71_9AGAR|nr:hypothetical protein DFH08DRAFT_1070508 [Mycena albidolilacea]
MNTSSALAPPSAPASPPNPAMDALALCFAGLSFKKNSRDPDDDDDDEQAVKKLRAGSHSSPVSVLLLPPRRVLPPTPQGPGTITVPYAVICVRPTLTAYRQKELLEWNAFCDMAKSSESQHAPRSPPAHIVVKELVVAVKPALTTSAQKELVAWNARCLKSKSHLKYADRMSWNAKCWDSHLSRHAPNRKGSLEAAASSTTDGSPISLKAAPALDAPKSAMAEDKQRVFVFDTIAANAASSQSVGSSTVDGSSHISPSATLEGKPRVSVFDTIAANAASRCNVGSLSVDGLSLISPSAKLAPDTPNGAAAHWQGFLRPSVFDTGTANSVFAASVGPSTATQGKQRAPVFNSAASNAALSTVAAFNTSLVLKDVTNTGARSCNEGKGNGNGKVIDGGISDAFDNLASTLESAGGNNIGGSSRGGGAHQTKKCGGRAKASPRYCVY